MEDESSEDDMVEITEIKSYEAPGALLKSREALGSNSSAKMYDNVPKTPTKSNNSESYFHGEEEGADSDGKGKHFTEAKQCSWGVYFLIGGVCIGDPLKGLTGLYSPFAIVHGFDLIVSHTKFRSLFNPRITTKITTEYFG